MFVYIQNLYIYILCVCACMWKLPIMGVPLNHPSSTFHSSIPFILGDLPILPMLASPEDPEALTEAQSSPYFAANRQAPAPPADCPVNETRASKVLNVTDGLPGNVYICNARILNIAHMHTLHDINIIIWSWRWLLPWSLRLHLHSHWHFLHTYIIHAHMTYVCIYIYTVNWLQQLQKIYVYI